MTNKNELAEYAKMILEHPMYKTTLKDIKGDITTDILTTKPDENHSRDDYYFTWKGVDRFMSKLQSYIDQVDSDDRVVEERKVQVGIVEMQKQAEIDALKGL